MESVIRIVVEPYFETILKKLIELEKKIINLDTKITKMEHEILNLHCKLDTNLSTLDITNCKMETIE